MSCSKAAPAQCLQRCFLHGCLLFRLLHPGLLSLKPLDLDMYRRESFLLELIAQRVGGFLLCFSNQSWSFYEGNHTGYTMLLCLLKFRLWESKIQLWGVACWRWFRCLHLSYFLWADFSVTATNVFPVCHYCLKLLLPLLYINTPPHQMTALPWTPLPWSPLAAWEPLSAACSWTTLTRGWVETTWQTCWPKSPTQRWWVQQWGKLRPARSNYSIILVLHNNALLIIIIATSHDSSIKGSLVNNSDDFSSGRLKLFTFHGESEGEQAFGSWLWSQTAAIKSSGRGNVFLKLRAHILVVGHMQFLCMAPPP